ncbi:MutS_V domain-containing protein/MutS_I domain-containing protein/MutS_II domain-containing protein/MutS_IV domain-containing protein/MutS_III domain-containing protein [Cephalotus follicularis]|uniref:DNA mismatch repair protein n=1 Tax=Cephalotus follicularis TaxID=3775 RepID=A0A1Q3D4K1_CEPFO|nr:MutS_V domain-containing protein/MutS_I domain-containing protein/MutS_II domain-containing protein/MutS_IV domain-containing protein/MutS_III domain-containing protein [Cephalotus follicularis]
MAPTHRQNSGRSPLVNPQRQITAFFSKSTTPSPSPSPNISKPNPNPKSTPNCSPSPTTPSPLQPKSIKPLLLVGLTASPPPSMRALKSCDGEVLGKRIRVYWPLDKSWYEGYVKSLDKGSNKHLIQYDDGEEELLDLGKEKVEWIEEEESSKRFKRLRRGSFKRVAIEDVEMENVEDKSDNNDDDGDDPSDEDWGSKGNEVGEENEEEEEIVKASKHEKGLKDEVKIRKASGGGYLGSGKKGKRDGLGNGGVKVPVPEPVKNHGIPAAGEKASNGCNNGLMGDAEERFKAREAHKFHFLRERRDAKGRHPGDKNYDPRTLYLPPDFLKSLSGGQRQWWEFKSNHMDKVLFFKMGKFYELFEMDAHIGAKELDLQYMKGEQPHCGFPERNFSVNVEKLARKGYRVLVVEQTETPEQLEIRRKEKGSKDKVVKREICAVVTKGTVIEGELLSANPDASYLISVTESCSSLDNLIAGHTFGVCVVDVATSKVILGQFKDDLECSGLCCLLSQLRPVEIIKPSKMLSAETERAIMRHTRNPLVNELVPLLEFWDAKKTVCELETIYTRFSNQSSSASSEEIDSHSINPQMEENVAGCLPNILLELVSAGENSSLALSALGGTLYYLKQAFLDESLLRFAKFELLPCTGFGDVPQKPYMVLDAAALENLEIFENNRNGDSSGTLYAQLNHCVTAFGKRLLKTWLARPLYNLESVKERQDAVAGLRGVNLSSALEFRKALSRLPDMERLLARIFASSESNGRNANKVVLYEDAAKKQLQQFISALHGCDLMAQACNSLGVILENVESIQLHHLLTLGKGLPDLDSLLKHFKQAFDWVEANTSGRIIPSEGVDMEYDSACKTVKEIESSLTNHIKEQRKLLGDSSVNYVTVGKDTYLLEVPESLQRRIPRDYELCSSKKGFFRYWTPTIKKLLGELSQAESEKESTLKSILQRLIGRFCQHHKKWKKLVSATAELDVLISLAIASDFYEGPACRPIILGFSCSNDVPCFSAKRLGHPVLRSDSLGKGTFVPNDITIGGHGQASFILLTGPNMGGKSTLLRQVCLAVILAQVGADVPAESFELSPVDRIFVRMGAKDHIMAGQSTFLTELSETALMLSSATCNSLVALDELGRGTSTSDGQAIAESVLQHFLNKVHCRGMFSTHYHRLAVDYQKDPKVSLQHMACQVGHGSGRVEEVTFLHRLTPGACPKSYGVNVARLAGLPDCVLQKAAAKSREFEAIYGTHRKASEEGCDDEMVAFIRNLFNIATEFSSHECSGSAGSSLIELQHRARTLLQLN